MNADISLVEQSDSSACPARSLQNVPVRPPIAQSTPSSFCTFLRISQKISISQRLRAGCSLDTEGIGRKSQEKEGSRFCTEVAVGEPIGRHRFVLSSCLPLRLTNRWPVPQEPYRQEPFLVDEDRIGGSAIPYKRTNPGAPIPAWGAVREVAWSIIRVLSCEPSCVFRETGGPRHPCHLRSGPYLACHHAI